jgi:biotin carboxyl carrier protein
VRYYVTIASDKHVVDIVDLPNGTIQARVDERPIDLDVVAVGRQLSVRFGGQVIDLTTEGRPPEIGVVASGHRLRVRVESERSASDARAERGVSGQSERVVRSPMPGRVVKVLVAKGEAVEAGQGLIVLEAMKMENEIRAREAGSVAEVHVLAGATVEANATLITLE